MDRSVDIAAVEHVAVEIEEVTPREAGKLETEARCNDNNGTKFMYLRGTKHLISFLCGYYLGLLLLDSLRFFWDLIYLIHSSMSGWEHGGLELLAGLLSFLFIPTD